MKILEKKHPLAIRWFHWINFPILAVMVWSGLLIYWANPVYRIGLGKHTLLKMTVAEKTYEKANLAFRLAEGLSWHFFFMWFFAIERSDSGHAPRSPSPQRAASATKIQCRPEDLVHRDRRDGFGIAADRTRHLQAGAIRMADVSFRRLSDGALFPLLDHRRLRRLLRGAHRAGHQDRLEQLPRDGDRIRSSRGGS